MNVYKGYDSGRIEELGYFQQSVIAGLLREAVDSIKNDAFCIGINRSEKDFVEIRPVGNSQFMVWSDRLCRTGSFWSRFFQPANIEKIVEGELEALKAIEIYVTQSRESFEKAYT